MRKYFLPVLFILLLIFPADASSASKTKAQLLSYLTSLPSQSDKKVLSGQRTGWLNDGTNGHDALGADILADIATESGGYVPALIGLDIDKYNNGGAAYDLSRAIDHWNAGGIVLLEWFASNPYSNVYSWPMNANPPYSPVIDIADVYTPGNHIFNNFKAHLDYVAAAMQTLQDKGVVVLFRPFPEMNSACPTQASGYDAWGWWGGKDATKFKNMWIYVHNYLTVTKGLANIIWVYGPQGGMWRCELDYYPGSAYVDIVGISYYADRFYRLPQYESLKSLGKPFAFTEVGICTGDSEDWDECDNKDSRIIINDIKTYFPDSIYFMVWDDSFELGRQSYLPQLFADPLVVNRADNPSGTIIVSAPTVPAPTVPVTVDLSKKPSSPARVSIQ